MPVIYDECLILSISKLREWHCIKPDQLRGDSLTWSRNGTETASISILVNTTEDNSFIELMYNSAGEAIKYQVQLVAVPSNLGKGLIWYFICPHTGKRCRKLHLVGKYFYHRTAWRGTYGKQNRSHKKRQFEARFSRIFDVDEVSQQIYKKYFKPSYNGQPTKKYLRLSKKLNDGRPLHALSQLLR